MPANDRSKVMIGSLIGPLHGIEAAALDKAASDACKEGLLTGEVLARDHSVPMSSVLDCLARVWGVVPINGSGELENINLKALPPGPLSSIGRDFAMKKKISPLGIRDGILYVAALDPSVLETYDDVAAMTGIEVMPCVAARERIQQEIDRLWPAGRKADSHERFDTVSKETLIFSHSFGDTDQDLLMDSGSAVAEELNSMLRESLSWGSSDIHLEPGESVLCVRYRVDGVLIRVDDRPAALHPQILSRVKLLAGMDISERRLPQDGRFRVKSGDETVDIRVSVMPSGAGERAVMRLLRKNGSQLNLSSLGMPPKLLVELKRMLSRAGGIVIVTGPTGSGKSTTLYGCLKHLNDPGRNIMTIEDPIEYRIPGLGQIQVKPEIGFTFSSGLRSILRQDPDVIMVGEIRDPETAAIASHASMTGHLVLTTLHTKDAASAISRMVSLGVDRETIGGTLCGVVAQRLVRLSCRECGGKVTSVPCASCRGTGYRGRTGIFELIPVNGPVQKLISACGTPEEIRAAAETMGFGTLMEAGMDLVTKKLTTPEEIMRVADLQGEGTGRL